MIAVTSQAGGGATFTVELPLERALPEMHASVH